MELDLKSKKKVENISLLSTDVFLATNHKLDWWQLPIHDILETRLLQGKSNYSLKNLCLAWTFM